MLRLPLVFFLILLGAPAALAQRAVVQGTVTDAQTGEPLPAAAVVVPGTYVGTITNSEGAFQLALPDGLPATLAVRFIGYERAEVEVAEGVRRVDVALEPATFMLDEIVVTDEDPGMRIMREVIRRKQQWRDSLDTWQAEAYTRLVVSNDTGIVAIIETLTDAFWREDDGLREVERARRRTGNLEFEDALPAAGSIVNLYDDEVDLAGYDLIGVTHPDALRHYRFTLEATRQLDGRPVYDIRVEPRNRLKSAFRGRVSVLGGVYALLEAELAPGEAFLFPPPIQNWEVVFRQQFSDFGGPFWLPVDVRSEQTLEIGLGALLSLPTIHLEQVARLSNYQVNVLVPDSLWEEDAEVVTDSLVTTRADSLLAGESVVPLTEREQVAYAEIDSTDTLEEAFKPGGALGRMARSESDSTGGGFSLGLDLPFSLMPVVRYNRVDELHAGARIGKDWKAWRAEVFGGRSTGLEGDDAWRYGGSLELDPKKAPRLEAAYTAETARRYGSPFYPQIMNGADVLLGGEDYFDYYRSRRLEVTAVETFDDVRVGLRFMEELTGPLPQTTSYDFLGEPPLRANPGVASGRLRSLAAQVQLGSVPDPLGVSYSNSLVLRSELGAEAFGSDFHFARFSAVGTARIQTLLQRRLLPMTLDVRATAGLLTGDRLPLHRLLTVDGSLSGAFEAYKPFGTLHTREAVPDEGDRHAALFWEHNFRTAPFELLGLDALTERFLSVLVHGGHARTWMVEDDALAAPYLPRTSDGWHHEIGLGVSGLFQVLRIDVSMRLDEPGWAVGVSTAKLF